MFPGCSLLSTALQPEALLGFTHASRVSACVRSSDAASATATWLDAPSNERPPPKRPAGVQLAPLSVPVLPCPEASAVVPPLPSAKAYAATGFDEAGGITGAPTPTAMSAWICAADSAWS